MQTLKLQIEDNLYNDIVKVGIDVHKEVKTFLKQKIYKKELKIANNLNKSIADIKQGNVRDLEDLLNEV